MSLGESIQFWFAKGIVGIAIAASFILAIFIAAVIKVFVIDPIKEKRKNNGAS